MLTLRLLGSLALAAGLLAVFLTWRRPGVRTGAWVYALPAGWMAIVIGLILWGTSTHLDQGLALGSVLVMTLACALVAGQGLKLITQPAKVQRTRTLESDGVSLGRGYWSRFAARLTGSLIVAPAAGAAVGLLWPIVFHGEDATRIMGVAILAVSAATAALVYQLSSRRPWRAFAIIAATGMVAGGVAGLAMVMS